MSIIGINYTRELSIHGVITNEIKSIDFHMIVSKPVVTIPKWIAMF